MNAINTHSRYPDEMRKHLFTSRYAQVHHVPAINSHDLLILNKIASTEFPIEVQCGRLYEYQTDWNQYGFKTGQWVRLELDRLESSVTKFLMRGILQFSGRQLVFTEAGERFYADLAWKAFQECRQKGRKFLKTNWWYQWLYRTDPSFQLTAQAA